MLVTTPTIVATIDAALAAAAVAAGTVVFAASWALLVPLQRRNVDAIRNTPSRFPTPPEAP